MALDALQLELQMVVICRGSSVGPLEEHPLLSTAELFLEPYVSSAILYSQPPCGMGSSIFSHLADRTMAQGGQVT